MKVLVTGASGFVASYVIPRLLEAGHDVVATSRDNSTITSEQWSKETDFVEYDLNSPVHELLGKTGSIDAVVHLAWGGLPNYHELFHYEKNLVRDYGFLKQLIESGTKHVMVAGTCFEYGMQDGCLSETMAATPDNAYGIAKNSLRQFLESLSHHINFRLIWPRLFYVFGDKHRKNGLVAHLEKAIQNNDQTFPMSPGDQIRDFIAMSEAADQMVSLLENPNAHGIYNVSTNQPTSVRSFVEHYLEQKDISMKLNLGTYPYPDYEPLAFWGNNNKIKEVLNNG